MKTVNFVIALRCYYYLYIHTTAIIGLCVFNRTIRISWPYSGGGDPRFNPSPKVPICIFLYSFQVFPYKNILDVIKMHKQIYTCVGCVTINFFLKVLYLTIEE